MNHSTTEQEQREMNNTESIEDRPASMELRVIINALARASVLSNQETERLRLEALAMVDTLETINES
jgi:hypothetical protein